jgi:hypothetical protein
MMMKISRVQREEDNHQQDTSLTNSYLSTEAGQVHTEGLNDEDRE